MTGPRLGIWGTFDVANYGDLLFPRIFEQEMVRRLPLASVRAFSPFGHLHPVAMDGGQPAEPLGAWEPKRCAELARELDFVAVGGGEIIHARDDVYGIYYGRDADEMARWRPSGFFIDGLGRENEASCAVAWHGVGVPFDFAPELADRVREALATKAYVAVRDEVSRQRLLATGTDREVHVVPDSALLLSGLFDRELLARRVRYLRAMGWYPEDRPPLVLQGSAWIEGQATAVAQAVAAVLGELGEPPLVLLEIGPCHGDGRFADLLAAHLQRPVHRMPGAVALADVAAAIAYARAFFGLSLHGSLTALAYDVPFVISNLAGYSKLDGFARLAEQQDVLVSEPAGIPDALRAAFAPGRAAAVAAIRGRLAARVEAHFDALADLAERSWVARERGELPGAVELARRLAAAEHRNGALGRALNGAGDRLVEERLRFAELLERLEAEGTGAAAAAALAAENAELRTHVEVMEARLAAAAAGARRPEIATDDAAREREEHEEEVPALRARLAAYEHLLGTRLLRAAAGLQRALARLRRSPP